MSTTTATKPRPHRTNTLTAGQLPASFPVITFIASFALSGLIFGLMWMLSGDEFVKVAKSGKITMNFNWGAWLLVGALVYLIATYVTSRVVENPRKAVNRLVTGLLTTAFVIAMIPLLSLIYTLFVNGLPGLTAQFFTNDANAISGQRGGLQAIVGTLLITGATTLMAVPIGIFTAIYLVEYGKGNFLSRSINFFVDVMTGIPSIVAGLFATALVLLILESTGGDTTKFATGFAGALSLLVLMIPTVVRSAEEMIRLVPPDLREASYALGVPKWRTITKVVLPTCLAGLVTGVLLAIARVIGETAPLMVAAGMTVFMNTNLFNGAMSSLPTMVYQQWKFTTDEGTQLAWTGALVLLIIVLLLNLIGQLVKHYFSPKGSR